MKRIKILILIFFFILLNFWTNNMKIFSKENFHKIRDNYVRIEPYLYQENFTINNPIKYWTKSSNLSNAEIKYDIDKTKFSKGDSSLSIDANITTLSHNDKWHYYMKIPLEKKPNLEGNLSFSIDINVDKESAKYLQIGLNLDYYPIKNATYIFKKISTFDQWISVKSQNIKNTIKGHTKRVIKKIFNGELQNIGIRINYIGILLRGRGDKHIKFHIDNLKIKGTQTNTKEFIENAKKAWNEYSIKIKKIINNAQKQREQLPIIRNIRLSPLQQERYLQGKKYIKKIDSMLKEIKEKKYSYIKTETIKELNSTIKYYMNNYKSLESISNISVYKFSPFKYYRLNGYNTPILKEAKTYKLRMTAGEYKSIALIIRVNHHFGKYSANSSDFIGDIGSFSKNNFNLYISKIWYQAGVDNTYKTGKFLTQELLLKDESLIKVDFNYKTNYLKIRDKKSGKKKYIDISNPKESFPNTDLISFDDTKELQPFRFDSIRDKLLWGVVHIPPNTKAGVYQSTIEIKNLQGKIEKKVKIEVEVLPFKLDPSNLIYSLYYHGKLDNRAKPISTYKKNAKQLEIELKDIKEHGVLYPTSYDNKTNNLDKVLSIRDKLKFPKDRFYSLGIYTNSKNIKNKIKKFQNILDRHGYSNNLYIYSKDEAKESELKKEKKRIEIAQKVGAKVFVAGYNYTHRYIGNILNLLIYAGGAVEREATQQIKKWHDSKQEIFAYASPQVGVENPEIYRRNFGCKLWQKGFDGAMDYAYQKQYGAFWNDFDGDSRYREEAFTYPTSHGIIGTIEWEGYREAITDVRYISTLENLRDRYKERGEDTSRLDLWLKNIDCNGDLEKLRQEIIDKILSINL